MKRPPPLQDSSSWWLGLLALLYHSGSQNAPVLRTTVGIDTCSETLSWSWNGNAVRRLAVALIIVITRCHFIVCTYVGGCVNSAMTLTRASGFLSEPGKVVIE